MEYNFTQIEPKWQEYWKNNNIYKAENKSNKPKYYILDMFPYPSGDGLHVGHPLGYIASDIVARYKRLNGFNVLHPMGFDAFGLPAENHALQTGQHPAVTTRKNVETYQKQLQNVGLSFDWDRKVDTSDPNYYKFTQQIFLWLFNSWYNPHTNQAENIDTLVQILEKQGNTTLQNAPANENTPQISAQQWQLFDHHQQQNFLMNYRLCYKGMGEVWFCEQLSSVLANDEVKDGLSERGGYPVERRKLTQWFLRTTAYADRLLNDLNTVEWSEAIKEAQRNWIGKSEGAIIDFKIKDFDNQTLTVFTTRPDTIFGVTFMVLAPEHELIQQITSSQQKQPIAEYIAYTKRRSERDRQADVKNVTGCFTGAYCLNPFDYTQQIPIYISEYVLAGYGTGAIMAVPSSDDRDYRFAQHFNLPIIQVIDGAEKLENPTELKKGTTINSAFLNGLQTPQAITKAIQELEKIGVGTKKINYRLRDANCSRQRYWGEPIPIIYSPEGTAQPVPQNELPLILPPTNNFKPTPEGKSPLAHLNEWVNLPNHYTRETDTMPGYAGSSWYFLRYMDAQNPNEFASKQAIDYWQNVDFYIGGSEHAVGHLLYARMWYKFLFDLKKVPTIEPFQKLVNQGMIGGRSNFVYRLKDKPNVFVSKNSKNQYDTTELHVNVNLVKDDILDIEAFKKWRPEYHSAEFILDSNNQYVCGWALEKMSKSKHNVVNPDHVIAQYGADCFRMYEMFLGPIEAAKPWDTKGIEGVSRFLRKLWRLFGYSETQNTPQLASPNTPPTPENLKTLHKTIKKITEDIERFSLNTCISAFMECTNELADQKCNHPAILAPLVILISPFAPFIAEELWQNALNNPDSVHNQEFPIFNQAYIIESEFEYPIQINGKMRAKITLPLNLKNEEDVKNAVLALPQIQQWIETPQKIKKFILVHGKIINVVA